MITQKKSMFYRCYYGFLINGMVVLFIGSILPYLIRDTGISYGIAGGLLSAMAIGNLCASLLYPILSKKLGRKRTVVMLAALFPGCHYPPASYQYLILMFLPYGDRERFR